MFNLSWARGAAAAALLAAAALPALAAPIVADFEPGFVIINAGETYTQSGFGFTALGSSAVIDPIFCASAAGELCANGNSTSVLSALNDAVIDLSHSRIFSLGSFSASFVPYPDVDFFSGLPIKLKLDGLSVAGAAVGMLVDLLEDGSNPGNFLFSSHDASALGALRSLQFSVCFDNGLACEPSPFANDGRFALDDLSLTVPEPGAAWLVALSLAGLALTRRRRAR